MYDDVFIVALRVDIEVVPQVASDGNAAESPFSYLLYVVQGHSSLGDDAMVDNTLPLGVTKFVGSKGGFVFVFRDAVEDVAQQDILALRLHLFDALQVVASACDGTMIRSGSLWVSLAEVYAQKTEFVAQVEMVVYDNLAAVLLWHETQEPLAIYWF